MDLHEGMRTKAEVVLSVEYPPPNMAMAMTVEQRRSIILIGTCPIDLQNIIPDFDPLIHTMSTKFDYGLWRVTIDQPLVNGISRVRFFCIGGEVSPTVTANPIIRPSFPSKSVHQREIVTK